MLCRLFIPVLWKAALDILQQGQDINGRNSISDALDAGEWIEASFELVVYHEPAPCGPAPWFVFFEVEVISVSRCIAKVTKDLEFRRLIVMNIGDGVGSAKKHATK
jgi:hypothetical protein